MRGRFLYLLTMRSKPLMLPKTLTFVLSWCAIQSIGATWQPPPGLLSGSSPTESTLDNTRTEVEQAMRKGLKESQSYFRPPRRWNLRTNILQKRLGKHWDPFWMSVQKPVDFIHVTPRPSENPDLYLDWDETVNTSGLANRLREMEHSFLDRISLGAAESAEAEEMMQGKIDTFLGIFREWMMERTACPVNFVWDDLGIQYWPRFVRHGFCSMEYIPERLTERFASHWISSYFESNKECSWPPGMMCVPGKETVLTLLKWRCGPKRPYRPACRKTTTTSAPDTTTSTTTSSPTTASSTAAPTTQSKIDDTTPTSNSSGNMSETPTTARNLQALYAQLTGENPSLPPGFVVNHGDVSALVDTSGGQILTGLLAGVPLEDDPLTTTSDQGRHRRSAANKQKKKCRRTRKRWSRCRWVKVKYPVTAECYCSC